MSKTTSLTPEQRIAKLEESLAKVDTLETQVTELKEENASLKTQLEEQSKEEPAPKEEPEAKVEETAPEAPAPEAKTEEQKEARSSEPAAGLTKEEIASAVADAISPMKEELSGLKAELTSLKTGNEEASHTKQPGGEESLVDDDDAGAVGNRESAGESYADLFASDPMIAKINTEGLTYEEACNRDDDFGLRLLSTMQSLHGTESAFKAKQDKTAA